MTEQIQTRPVRCEVLKRDIAMPVYFRGLQIQAYLAGYRAGYEDSMEEVGWGKKLDPFALDHDSVDRVLDACEALDPIGDSLTSRTIRNAKTAEVHAGTADRNDLGALVILLVFLLVVGAFLLLTGCGPARRGEDLGSEGAAEPVDANNGKRVAQRATEKRSDKGKNPSEPSTGEPPAVIVPDDELREIEERQELEKTGQKFPFGGLGGF